MALVTTLMDLWVPLKAGIAEQLLDLQEGLCIIELVT
jgi:hypothetical protein